MQRPERLPHRGGGSSSVSRFQLLDDGRLRVRAGLAPADLAAGAELVARSARGGEERRSSFEHSGGGSDLAQAFIDVFELLPAEAPDDWVLHVSVGGAEPQPLAAGPGTAGRKPRVVAGRGGLYRMRARSTDEGTAVVRCRSMKAHAEVELVEVGDDAITISGTAGRDGVAQLVATSRNDGAEHTWPVERQAERFKTRIELAALVREGAADVWRLHLEIDGERLRLGSHADEVFDKAHVMVYPARPAIVGDTARRVRPYYTVRNRLSLRSNPVPVAEARERRERPTLPVRPARAPGAETPRPAPRRGPKVQLVKAVQAVAGVALRLAIGRRERPAAARAGQNRKVYVLLLNAYGIGGTIRTTLNLVDYLRHTHDVELISLIRRRERPAFRVPDGVAVSTVDDRRKAAQPTGWRGALADRARKLPSLIVHPEDWAFSRSNLRSDLRLLRKLRSLEGGVLITTRPALNLIAAQFAPAGTLIVGQEHLNFRAHRPGLANQMARHYGKLDALVVLTDADRADYREVLAGSPTTVARITNALPHIPGTPEREREKIVLAAGRLTWQKGFDLLIDAFVPVARKHPDWTLRIYGDGARRQRLRRRILRHGLYNNVFLMGSTQRLGEFMSRASVFALSSRYEGFGMVIVEAMNKGLPVVSFDCPQGPGEIIDHGRDGILIAQDDVDGFSRALLDLIEDRERREAIGRAAIDKAHKFDISEVGAQWDSLFADLTETNDDRTPEPAAA